MTHPALRSCLLRLYGFDAIDRLEAVPELTHANDDVPFAGPMAALAELDYVRDPEEDERFKASCARELAGGDE